MRIAIVAPSPVPFTVGGAEKLWWGLLREINRNTNHQAELLKIPVREHTFWDLIDSYERFCELDLSYFDLVISTKYPAWMVSHPRHVCYMQHPLRGLYDSFHFNKLPERYSTVNKDLASLQRLMSSQQVSRDALAEIFASLRRMKDHPDVPSDAFAFPGSLIREIVHYFDRVALQTTSISRFFAISHTVANRPSYFPPGASIEVLYHPSNLDYFRNGESNYLFTASRLDGPKRLDLLIAAMKLSRATLPLYIAGEGPARARLQDLAEHDERIHFLGYRSDAQLIEDYADARAVAFVPSEEDYGLITVEAMMSSKAVLTVHDAGGPNELVRHGITGLSVKPEPGAIAEAIEYVANDPSGARAMGEKGFEAVQAITWSHTVTELLGDPVRPQKTSSIRPRRGRATVATTFPVTPVRGGGQVRIFHLYKEFVPSLATELITLGPEGSATTSRQIAPGLTETCIPKTREHAEAEAALSAKVEWLSITDVVFPRLYHLTPQYLEAVERSSRGSDVVIASHPYVLPVLETATDKPLWYEAQDVEQLLKSEVIPKTAFGLELIADVTEIEKRCCERAELVMACSDLDGERLISLYGIPANKMRTVPNGVDTKETRFISRSECLATKHKLGFSEEFLALFVGSWHPPNIEALSQILRMAEQLSEVFFLIAGSSCSAFQSKPSNVAFFAEVESSVKDLLLGIADVALNPMQSGSGTNLKMLEYASSGVPIITTSTGARGLGFEDDLEVVMAEIPDFVPEMRKLRQTRRAIVENRSGRARRRVESYFDWSSIARRFIESL